MSKDMELLEVKDVLAGNPVLEAYELLLIPYPVPSGPDAKGFRIHVPIIPPVNAPCS